MWLIRWIALAIVVLAVLTFALYNQEQTVSIRMFKWESDHVPLYLALFASFVFGMIAFLLIAFVSQLQVLRDLRHERKKRKKAEETLAKLEEELDGTKEGLKTAQARRLALEEEQETLKKKLEGKSGSSPPATT